MNFLNNTILNSFLVIPFVFAAISGMFVFIKNPVYIRNLTKLFFFFEFIFSSLIFVFFDNAKTTFLNLNFVFDKTSVVFIFLISSIFLLFSLISKTFITKSHNPFYIMTIVLYGLLNLAVLSDNIFISLMSVFWMFLVQYFLSELFSKQNKRSYYNIALNIFWILFGLFLISYDCLRYFILNEIPFNYSFLESGFSHLSDFSINLAFLGFLIIIFRLFNFIPFINIENNSKPFVNLINTISTLAVGSYLLIKIYSIFNYNFYQYQNYIALYLILNLLWFSILVLKQDKVVKFLNQSIIISLIISIFPMFSFEQNGLLIFIYSIFAIIFSYIFAGFVLLILSKNFNTDSFLEFKRIDDKNKLDKFLVSISLFNISRVPLGAMFSSFMTVFFVIFSYDYDSSLLNIAPYCLLLATFGLIYSSYCLIGKIYTEPLQIYKKPVFSNHQIFVFVLLIFLVLILGLFFSQFINHFIGTVEIEQLEIGNF